MNILKFAWGARKRFNNWSTEQISKHQKKQSQKIVRYAKKHTKFYSEFYKGYDSTDFDTLPIMNKILFMDNFTQLNTKGLTREECIDHCLEKEQSRDFSQYYKGYLVGMSTGTSGNKGLEFVTKLEGLMMKLLVYFRFPFPKTRKIHLAFILRVFSPGFGHNGAKIRISYVSPLDTIELIIDNLNSLNPNLVSGPPSVLQTLGKFKKKGLLKVSPILIVSYGEVLELEVKEEIESDFKCQVIEVYKSSESFIGLPCKNGKLHINEDTTLVEILDKDMQPVEPGKPGTVVVTDFIKYAAPIIRYQLNDLLTIDPEPCACGSNFRVIKQIHGRADDVIIGRRKDKEGFQFILPDFIRRSIVSSTEFVEEYSVIQTSPVNITIRLQLDTKTVIADTNKTIQKNLENSIQQKISDIFIKHESKIPEIEFVYEELSHDFDKKLRRIRRTFKEDF